MDHEVQLLEEWLDGLMGDKWAQQRATTRQRISGTVDWVVYISWLREIVAAWRYARQGGNGVWSRRN